MNERDIELFANKPIFKSIMALAIPSVVGQIILVLYNMADTYFVGLTKDNSMLTAVSICMPAYMILTAISNLFGVGAASVIARSLGKKNHDRAKNSASFAVWGCIGLTLLYAVFLIACKDPFINWIGGSNPAVHDKAGMYLMIAVVGFALPTTLNTLFSHLLRAQGKSLHASIGIVLGAVLNIALDPLFIFCINGIEHAYIGVALATGIANFIALIYYIVYLIHKRESIMISFKIKKAIFQNHIPGEVIIVGTPACLMTLCENISYAVLDNLMSGVSLSAQAGVGVAKKINMFAHSAVRGMAQGVLPLIGFNKSSGNRQRMKKIVFASGGICVGIALVCLLINYCFATQLSSIFIQDQATQAQALYYSAEFLKIFSIGAPFSAIAYTVISFFQAVGKAWRSLILALLRKGILDIPLMFILQIYIPIYGIVWATPIADIACCVIALVLFFVYLKLHGQNKGEFAKTIEDN